MTDCPQPATRTEQIPTNPWERWGWLMWAVWLIFLAFPAMTVLSAPGHGTLWRVGGLGVIAAFAGVYIWGALRLEVVSGRRKPAALLGTLIGMALLSTYFLGMDAVSFTPFLVSFAAFTLPSPWHWAFGAATIGLCVALMLVTGQFADFGYFLFILVSVAVGVNAARMLADQSEDYDETRRGLAVSAERERVARDVHDVLGHSLTVVTVKAELAERLVDRDPERAKRELVEIQTLSREALAEIRATIGGLRAARLADEIEAADRALTSAGIEAQLPEDVLVTDPRLRAVLGWVLREAVTNVVRHSRADHCAVVISEHGLTVTDDGVGLGGRRGNGLRGLEERVADSGGTLILQPGPGGRGTTLEVTW